MVRVQELTVGEVYRNRNGWDYLCLENAGPGVVVLERVSDGWNAAGARHLRVRGREHRVGLVHLGPLARWQAEKEGEARCLNCQSTSGSF